MTRTLVLPLALTLAACPEQTCPRDSSRPVVTRLAPLAAPAAARQITVAGTAEIFTVPDTFELAIGFEVQADSLAAVRDGSRRRAAALLDVAARHAIPAGDVQTTELSVRPRHDNYERRAIVGYEASRSLLVTLRDIDAVEAVLYDMLAAGANRVEWVHLHSSAVRDKRAEARVLAVQAARAKAEAMAAALGQQLGEPLQIVEDPAASGLRPALTGNVALTNDSVPESSETVAGGRIRVAAGVSVVFALAPA